MAEIERLNGTLQENIITLLAHNDEYGKIIAARVKPQLFEGEYRTIAERALSYWARHGEAPKHHMADLMDDILSDTRNRRSKSVERILRSMLELAPNINAVYVTGELTRFNRGQRFKDAVLKSAEQLNSSSEVALEDVEPQLTPSG